MKISVGIPVYILDEELEFLTRRCLDSLNGDCELIIIDNASPIKLKYDCDIYIRNRKNIGNGAAWNQILKVATGDVILLSDNDVIFPPNWRELANHTENSIVFPATRNKGEQGFVERLSGFFWMLDRKTQEKIGLIDEKYGIANFEDTDYFRRAELEGVKLKCVPEVKVDHYSRATCDKVEAVNSIYERNKKLYEDKFGEIYPQLNE